VPELNRKIDVIPGQTNDVIFDARTAGVFRGQCAEFCGLEHARMGFVVVVQTVTDFDRWMTRERLTPSAPDGEAASEGEVALVSQACAGCHTIRGTPARGTVGPDLTDFGERTTIGARTVPNTPQNLAKWIVDAQEMKPGALMPPMPMSDRDVTNIITYLEGLK
jgi:cytochrome c oxidase subunit II